MNDPAVVTNIENISLQTLIEHVQAGIVVHSWDTTILMANREASRILGLSVDQMQGKIAVDPAWHFVKEDGTPLPLEEYPVQKAIATLKSFENYIIGINRPETNDLVWGQVNAYPEFGANDQLIYVIVTFVDITEQITARKALAETEATFLKVFQYSPGIVMITSVETGTILDTNNKILETGYSREELLGHSIAEINFWNNPSERVAFERRMREAGKVENFEAHFRKKSGDVSICLISGEYFKFHNNNCIISVLIDITERKKEENEMNILYEIIQGVVHTTDVYELLKLIHQSLKKVLYAENCFFALRDENTGLFSFPYFVDQYDVTPPPLKLAKSCTSYVFRHGKSELINREKFKELQKKNEIELVGSPSPSWIGVPLKTSSGTIGVLVLQHYSEENIYKDHHLVFLDSIGNQVANVIERKRAETELEKSHSILKATLESTADGILVVDQNGVVTDINRKFIELWRIPDSIANSRSDKELLSFVIGQVKEPKKFTDKITELYLNEEEISTDLVEFSDGRIFERYSQAQMLNGSCVGRVWSFRDITAQKEAITALHISEKRLRELNLTKDKFFSIIAHDLKSPFNGILGFSNILSEQIKLKDYDGVEEYSEIIQFSSQKAVDLLMNLMEWSRAQSGRMDFNPESTEIVSLINEIYDLSNISAVQKSINLLMDAPGIITLNIDREMIASVLRNLISNAIKFTHPGGKILIKAEKVENELKVTVTDNGVGIDKPDLAKLFRIDESYSIPGTRNERGTGLGLILCKEFIDKHAGRIWAESEKGMGSKFTFTIPIL